MINSIKDMLTTRAATIITMWIVSLTVGCTGAVLVLGKAAFEDNTVALASYEKKMVSFEADNLATRKDLTVVTKMATELRKSSFDDKVRNLSKQMYKMAKDTDDIKPSDMAGAADFCASTLFNDYTGKLSGSRLTWAETACSDIKNWIQHHSQY